MQSCKQGLEEKTNLKLVLLTCKVLLLQNISDPELQLFKSLFAVNFPTFVENSQLKFVLFHLLMNRIVRYTFDKKDFKRLGSSLIDKNSVRMFYWYNPQDKFMNWGDILGPVIVEKLSHLKVVHTTKKVQNVSLLYGVGSILTQAMEDRRPYVTWGPGLIKAPTDVELMGAINRSSIHLKNGKMLSVRGPESQVAMLAMRGTFAQISKDPGLLISHIFPARHFPKPKEAEVCLIPHYVDKQMVVKVLKANKTSSSKKIKLISVSTMETNYNRFAEQVAREIISCRRVLSSSLHGLIASHAYRIPGKHAQNTIVAPCSTQSEISVFK